MFLRITYICPSRGKDIVENLFKRLFPIRILPTQDWSLFVEFELVQPGLGGDHNRLRL